MYSGKRTVENVNYDKFGDLPAEGKTVAGMSED